MYVAEEKMCKYQNSANKLPTFHSGNGACSLKAVLPAGHGPLLGSSVTVTSTYW